MTPSVEVVVPYLGGCPHRARALEWCRLRYGGPVTIAGGEPPWSKAKVAMPAIERSRAEVVVCADADVWCDGLQDAIEAVQDGAPYAIPHTLVHRLSKAGTAEVLAGADWREQPLDQPPYVGIEGGGYIVARRETLLEVPLDPRFVGWGQEDHSWGMALFTLLGTPWRGNADLVHLWHPPQDRMTRKYGSIEGRVLWRRYVQARRDKSQMRALLEESRDAYPTTQPKSVAGSAL
jgi:hypothetical protein